ncbi:MAG: HIT family protein [Acidimicrobiia bacterium]
MEALWAGWRAAYVSGEHDPEECLFCRLPQLGPDEETFILERGERGFSVLNLFPYTTGHFVAAPYRHVAELGDLTEDERSELWRLAVRGQRACGEALRPQGFNLGANLGRVAGAGVPDHFHLHVVPRWEGDTNFMTSLASVRVMPEALPDTWAKLRKALLPPPPGEGRGGGGPP